VAETGSSVLSKLLQGEEGFATPDISRAQALAVGQAAVALLVVLGFNVPDDVQTAIIALAAVLGVTLPASDAVLRQSRAKNAVKIAEARVLDRGDDSPDLHDIRMRLTRAELALAEVPAPEPVAPPSASRRAR
jgi:hypothetical protein